MMPMMKNKGAKKGGKKGMMNYGLERSQSKSEAPMKEHMGMMPAKKMPMKKGSSKKGK